MNLVPILALTLLTLAQMPVLNNSPSAQENVRKLIASLPLNSRWRNVLERGMHGDGIHYQWMDQMRVEGVKLAVFSFEFDWTDRGKKLSNWSLVSEQYYSDYDERNLITSTEQLNRIGATGLQKNLKNIARARAECGNWIEYPAEERGKGYRQIFLADNEWLPIQLSSFFGEYEEGTTPLMRAAMLGDIVRIKKLLDKGVDVNAASPDGSTALIWAAATGTPVSLKALLHAGATVNLNPDGKGDALIAAVANDRPENVAVLLKAGADPNSKNAEGQRALPIAKTKGYTEIARLLTQAGAHE